MSSRAELKAEIRRLTIAKNNTSSRYLRSDYDKAIKRKQKELKIFDYYQRSRSV